MTFVIAAVTGAVGAACRFLLARSIAHRLDSDFPFGTMTVNVLGAFALGLLVGGADVQHFAVLAGIGFLGGFTTFSTWMVESVDLGIPPLRLAAVMNVAIPLAVGLVAAAVGYTTV